MSRGVESKSPIQLVITCLVCLCHNVCASVLGRPYEAAQEYDGIDATTELREGRTYSVVCNSRGHRVLERTFRSSILSFSKARSMREIGA